MSKVNIDIDFSISLDAFQDENGKNQVELFKVIYVGNEHSPSYEESVKLSTLLEQYIESHSIPSSPPRLRKEHYKEIMEGLNAMAECIENAKKDVDNLKVWKSK